MITARIMLAALMLILSSVAAAETQSFVTFESGQVRPLALSPNGRRLYAVNTPDNRLEVFDVDETGLSHQTSVRVGLEPVAVAARNDAEVWVVNHLSDSVSVIDVTAMPPRVIRTLLVGDEPRDIVFAGPGGGRAFVSAAHRGQNLPFDPQLATPGVGRADVWVFDADQSDASLGGTPLTILSLFGDTPRALAATADGKTVLAAVFQSGNQTTTVSEGAVCDGGEQAPSCIVGGVTMPGGLPGPNTNADGVPQPETGLIVKYNPRSGAWEDELARDWSAAVRFRLPDQDVFAIDATADPPVERTHFAGVGTVLFNMATNPRTGRVYVSNTEARNEVRFEGPGAFAGHSVRGHLHEARVTILDPADGSVTPRHLNKHIDYAVVPSPPDVAARSLATPMGMAVTSDGTTLYVAAFGSAAIGVFDTAELEEDRFVPDTASHIALHDGGPSGLVLDEAHGRLYALTRFDNAVAVVALATRREIHHIALHNPEPEAVVRGRPFLYDASRTSSNGEASCAGCHVSGDLDSLAWDLGNPDDSIITNPNPLRGDDFGAPLEFHPMKGPMTTQTLRGMANHGPMHWRGDRTGGYEPGGDPLDERAAFLQFNPAFVNLIGRATELSTADMEAFADFMLQVTPPPNPIRALDNSLTDEQQAGRGAFFGPPNADGTLNCSSCHVLEPQNHFFGTDGASADAINFDAGPFVFKIPQLRNMYAKVGMFGMPEVPFFEAGDNQDMGDQIRGFGFLHDGSVDTILRFLREGGIDRLGFFFPFGDLQRRFVEDFLLAFDSDLAPIVGQQLTLTVANAAAAAPRIDLLIARAAAGECDLVASATVGETPRGWYRGSDGRLISDRASVEPVAEPELRAAALNSGPGATGAPFALTYLCAPPGSGARIGIDRDGDGALDGDEIARGSDPSNPGSLPQPCGGDCNDDANVGIDELVRAVGIALGNLSPAACVMADVDGDGAVAISELVGAVGHALTGCATASTTTT